VLEPGVARGESALLRREGDAYFLAVDEHSSVDAVHLLQATAAGHEAIRTGNQDRAIASFDRALELYAGEMMPEEGPADWLTEERETYRTAVVEAAFALAEVHAARGELVAGAFACERGLRVDRYRDSLWRLLIDLYERGGETAAAARSREHYRAVLSELGVEPDATR
jgi:DNA-binding SARP family transcriptional activator